MPDPQPDHEGAPRGPSSRAVVANQRNSGVSVKEKQRQVSSSSPQPQNSYDMGQVLGNGSFGVVTEARCVETGDLVAIKRVLQVRLGSTEDWCGGVHFEFGFF